MLSSLAMEHIDWPAEDPVLDPAPQGRLVKCRITRNRKGVRGG